MSSTIAPSGSPTAINVSSLNSTSLSISWSLLYLLNPIESFSTYIVNVSVAESQEKLQFETSSTTLTLNDLHPFYSHTGLCMTVLVHFGEQKEEETTTTGERLS